MCLGAFFAYPKIQIVDAPVNTFYGGKINANKDETKPRTLEIYHKDIRHGLYKVFEPQVHL